MLKSSDNLEIFQAALSANGENYVKFRKSKVSVIVVSHWPFALIFSRTYMLLLRLKPSDRNRIQESRYKVSCKSVFCSTSQFLLYQGLYWLRKRRG